MRLPTDASLEEAMAQGVAQGQQQSGVKAAALPAPANPILFVTQVPTAGDPFASRTSTFANHLPSIGAAPRGGDLMIRYPDGFLRNLTLEAGYGMSGEQGANAIAVREPAMHWNGQKAVFSMVIGAPLARYQHVTAPWQLYEITGLARGQTAVITKVAGQPAYNNVAPVYASDGRLLFASDRPRNGAAHLHPQLDEYESTPTVVGLYSLDPTTQALTLLNHTPSGLFSPTIDSVGRVIFTRWDHLQRDQQTESPGNGSYNFPDESVGGTNIGLQPESFPESRTGMASPYGPVDAFTYNLFTPWQMNQDGTEELSLNHIGRQELSFGYLGKSFLNDNALRDITGNTPVANTRHIRIDGGVFSLREDPNSPGVFYGIYAREFDSMSTGQMVRFNGSENINPEQMALVNQSPGDNDYTLPAGRYRNPLPMSGGAFVASYTPLASIPESTNIELRLRKLDRGADGMMSPVDYLTPGIQKTVSWWDPDNRRSYTGILWELEAVEVVARTPPTARTSVMAVPETTVFQQEGVNEATFKAWMKQRDLALIVVRNQTHRDRGDRQQPFNLRVPGGVSTTSGSGLVYDIAHFQIFQANLVRSYSNYNRGRRVLAQPAALEHNVPNPGPQSSVKIASDGSSAAFVPAKRALTWQTTDPSGNAIVRERLWVTMQPGEIRTCTGCHGENVAHQGGGTPSQAQGLALRELLRQWKSQNAPSTRIRLNGSQPLVH